MAAVTRYVMFRKNVSSLRVPARAGGPGGGPPRRGSARAYPRAGGGTPFENRILRDVQGLSPRRRGNRRCHRRALHGTGPIPAQAGEPRCRRRLGRSARAYPRAGGGTHACGGIIMLNMGLSPRRRGNRALRFCSLHRRGPIPAQAGEPPGVRGASSTVRAYPRAGGGTASSSSGHFQYSGLSPRRRGNRHLVAIVGGKLGPIPAQAGEPSYFGIIYLLPGAYPRAGGGTA